MQILRDIHTELPKFTCAAKSFELSDFDFADLPDGVDGQALATHSADVVAKLETLYQRCFTVIAKLAEQAEDSLGHAPLPAPVKAGASTVEA